MASESGESGQQQPKAKRQRCGRVALDVGGGKFVTSASTLTPNSHYFAALLSGDWSDSGDEELFIDQDSLQGVARLHAVRDDTGCGSK